MIPPASSQPQREPENKGVLEYGSVLPNGEDWRLRKFDAGMGESEYRIFKNEVFFAMFDNRKDADFIMVLMTRPHPPAPEPEWLAPKLAEMEKELAEMEKELDLLSAAIPAHDLAIARTTTLATLTDLATFLDNADNISDSGNANNFVPLPKLFKWIMERGGSHD